MAGALPQRYPRRSGPPYDYGNTEAQELVYDAGHRGSPRDQLLNLPHMSTNVQRGANRPYDPRTEIWPHAVRRWSTSSSDTPAIATYNSFAQTELALRAPVDPDSMNAQSTSYPIRSDSISTYVNAREQSVAWVGSPSIIGNWQRSERYTNQPVVTNQLAQENVPSAQATPFTGVGPEHIRSQPYSSADAALYETFRRRTKSRKFFVVGKVFLTLYSEPAGDVDSRNSDATSISKGSFGEHVFSKIRRFVVIRAGEQSCTALAISTYRHQGVAKLGVNKSEHAIIYTGKIAPTPQRDEQPKRGEAGLLSPPIRVDADDIAEKLDPMSRIDFGRVFNIEHNAKVRSFGKVHTASQANLMYQFRTVWTSNMGDYGLYERPQTIPNFQTDTLQASGHHLFVDLAEAHDILAESGWPEDRINMVLRTT